MIRRSSPLRRTRLRRQGARALRGLDVARGALAASYFPELWDPHEGVVW